MPDLFSIIPPRLFQPLAAPGAPVYAEILMALLIEAQRQPEPLSRDLAINVIYPLLVDPGRLDLTQDAAEAPATPEAAEPADRIQEQATAVLRYLERCGWLRVETQADFTQTYILPDYAFRLLQALGEIAVSQPPPLAGLICAIHDLMQAALAEGNADVRLPEAQRQTEQLINGLKELQHNIGLHINQVLRELPAREVLEAFFSTYQTEIVDRAYHQLRTTDHVSRFRPGVLAAAEQLEHWGPLSAAAQTASAPGEAATSPALRLVRQLRFVREQFEGLDSRLQAIDTRHSRYVSAAVRAVELQLEAHSTTSGQLALILTRLLHDQTDAVWESAEPLMQLHRLELSTPESLAAPTRAAQMFAAEPEPDNTITEAELTLARTATLQQLNRAVSREKIRRLAHSLLHNRPEARATELALANAVDLPLLIYLRAYGDGTLGYRVEALDEWVEQGEFAFRDFRLMRVDPDR
ncbi:MAG: hypothetical protein IT317_11560 [Anaerolineales bacterium]|nr:hypothetical protein [Anaerolineales bacterium]